MEKPTMQDPPLELVVTAIYAEAKDIIVIELQSQQRTVLPAFSPGAHLEVYLDNGLIRHYSLLNACSDTQRYVIAVSLSVESAGGSRFIHQQLRVGDVLKTSQPRNHFALVDAEAYCFIAGGIGITPILSMIAWCKAHHKKWRLFYTTRHRQRMAFYEFLTQMQDEQIHLHCNDEHQQQHLALDPIVQSLAEHEHLYCCGPSALMTAVQDSADKNCKDQQVRQRLHFEWFAAPASLKSASLTPPDSDHEQIATSALDHFRIELKHSGQQMDVFADQSILEVLEQHGYALPFSCRSGICRTCEVAVCAGTPEHHDLILSDEERAANRSLLICVSRSKSAVLQLDL